MKTIKIFLLLFVIVLFTGCGSSGGDDTESTDTSTDTEQVADNSDDDTYIQYVIEEYEATQNAYEFNDDGTALHGIEQLILNQWENPFPSDSFASANNEGKKEFYNSYIVSAIAEANNALPIYAPQGSAGDFTVDVNNSIADFTDYKLPADIDGDGRVTLEDDAQMLIDALVDNLTSSMYDVNNDNSVDNRDLLYLIARLLTQANSFHFYTTDGQDLGLNALSWDDTHTIDLSSLSEIPQQVRIIVRDENGASSVEDTPSITQSEWHINSSLETRSRQTRDDSPGCSIDSSILLELFPEAQSEFVIGFQGSIKHVMGHTVNGEVISKGDLTNCFNIIYTMYVYDSKVHKYFVPNNMNSVPRIGGNDTSFVVQEGFHYDKDLLEDIPAWNAYSKDIPTEVHGKNRSYKNSYTKGDKIIYTYSMVHIEAVYHESDAKYPLEGEIKRDSQDPYKDCGKLVFNRLDPAAQTDTKYSLELENNGYNITNYEFQDNLAMGHHQSSIKWEKGTTYELDDNFVFIKDETSHDFNIPLHDDVITGEVLDATNEPVSNVNLILRSTCDNTLKKYATTNENGSYEFKEVYIGEYEILIDDEVKATVAQTGEPVTKDFKTDQLWKFRVDFHSVYGSGSMTIKNFPIELDNLNSTSQADSVVFVGNDYASYSENTTISYSGISYDNGLSPLDIFYDTYFEKMMLEWNAIIFVENYPFQIGSGAMYGDATLCNGTLPLDFKSKVEAGEPFDFGELTGSDVASCKMTFEPCKNTECSDEDSSIPDDFDDEFND